MRKWFAGIGVILLVSVCSAHVGTTAAAGEDVGLMRLEKDGEASVYGRQRMKWVDEDGNTVAAPESNYVSGAKSSKRALNLPETYDLRKEGLVTGAKNQANSGSCWVFGGLGAMESNLVKKGLADVSEIDLSELHTLWFSYRTVQDETDPLYGDGETLPADTGSHSLFNVGGSYRLFTSTIARRSGAVPEEMASFAYTSGGSADVDTMAAYMEEREDDRYRSSWHLTQSEELDDAGADAVKQALLMRGALEVSYYTSASLSPSKNKNYHNYGEGVAYYQSKVTNEEKDNSNHTVLLAGWDDNFPKENFYSGDRPSKDGAWLIRNSWGDGWGDEGYFWISYEEPSLIEFVSVEAEAQDDYKNVYQYDGYDIWGCLNFGTDVRTANVFTANGLENLDAVAFYTMTEQAPYTVSVYKNLTGASPKTGKKVLSFSGVQEHRGYHTVALPERIYLDEGERFAIEIIYTCRSGERAYVPIEGDYEKYLESGVSAYACKAGQSFIYSVRGWTDVVNGYAGFVTNNIPIKAFTNPTVTAAQLQELVEEVSAMDTSDYTDESVQALETALQNAVALLGGASPAREELEKAKEAIDAAVQELKYGQSLRMEKSGDTLTWSYQAGGKFEKAGTLTLYRQNMVSGEREVLESMDLASGEQEDVATVSVSEQDFTEATMVYGVFETNLAGFENQMSEVYLYSTLAANGQGEVEPNVLSSSVLPVRGLLYDKMYEVSLPQGMKVSRLTKDIGTTQSFSASISFSDSAGWLLPEHMEIELAVIEGETVEVVYEAQDNMYGEDFQEGRILLDGKEVPAKNYVCLYSGTSLDESEVLEQSNTPPVKAGTYQVECLYDDAGRTGRTQGEVAIVPRKITLYANAVTMKQGESVPALSCHYESGALAKGDMLADIGAVFGTNATPQSAPGDYDVYLVSWENPNYEVTVQGKGKLKVEKISTPGTTDKGVQRIVLAKNAIAIGKGETFALTYTLSPSNATGRITFSSSNSSVASVAANGKITGKSTGSAQITAKAENGVQASIRVQVKKAPKKIVVKLTKKRIKKGKTAKIKVKKYKPAGSTSYALKYKSSRKKVAKVDASGKIKALKKGKTTITVVTYNKKKAKCRLTVY